jgi:hypothetical protein
MGRERPDLWADTARSIVDAAALLPAGWELQWCIHLDGIDRDVLTRCAWWDGLAVDVSVSAGPRRGFAMARNSALVNAVGDVIGVVDDDDRLGRSWPALVALLAERPDLGWAAGRTADIDIDGRPIERGPFPLPYGYVERGDPARRFLVDSEWQFHCCAAVARTELVHAAGGWAALPWCEDVSMWSSVTSAAAGSYLDGVVYEWRHHPARSTHTPQRELGLELGRLSARSRAAASLALFGLAP